MCLFVFSDIVEEDQTEWEDSGYAEACLCSHSAVQEEDWWQMIDVEDMVLLGQVGYLFKIIKKKSQEEKIVTSVKELH